MPKRPGEAYKLPKATLRVPKAPRSYNAKRLTMMKKRLKPQRPQ